MKKVSIVVLALATTLAVTSVARADDSFAFTFNDGGVSGSGTLYGTYEGAGNPWLITSGSGTFTDPDDNGTISLIPNPYGPGGSSTTPDSIITYDDLLDLFQVSGSYLDQNGLLFQFGNGDYLNIFFGYSVGGGGPDYYGWYDDPQGNGDDVLFSETGSFTITSYDIPASEEVTPAPGTLRLLGTGLFALAGLLLRRRATAGLVPNS